MRWLSLCLILVVANAIAAKPEITPSVKRIELQSFTRLNVELVPDLGSRFIFPFVLDEADDVIPFTLDITNPLFISTRHAGRNSFTVEIDPPPEGGEIPNYLGNLFITAGGYHISIVLSSTNALKRHVSDYVFELSSEARETLIQQSIKKRTESLEQSYREKLAGLDEKAAVMALQQVGALALTRPDVDAIKEEKKLKLPGGDLLTLYLSKLSTYGDRFHLLQYQLTNGTNRDITITDAGILTVDKGGTVQKLFSANRIKPRIEVGETVKGVITTNAKSITNAQLTIRLSVLTSAGLVEVDW